MANKKSMRLFWRIFTVLLIILLSSCDTTYKFKSERLSLVASLDIKECLHIEGVNSVFPVITKIYIEPKEQTQSQLILALIFYQYDDVLKLKSLIEKKNIQSISNLKFMLTQEKDAETIIGPYQANEFKTISLNKLGVLRDGMWILFIANVRIDSLEVQLEFSRTGINEFPDISIEEID